MLNAVRVNDKNGHWVVKYARPHESSKKLDQVIVHQILEVLI